MCRFSFSFFALVAAGLAGLMPCLGFAEIVQERMGVDGFPATWRPADFAIGKEIISASTPVVAVSGSGTSATFVTKGRLGRVIDGVGVLKLGSGGEAPDVWRKQGRADMDALLNKALDKGVASPALREGWRRLLLTEAAPPVAPEKGAPPSWLAVRAEALQKLGLFEASWALWKDIPQDALEEDGLSALGWVKTRLLAGQGQDACVLAKQRAATENTGNVWAPAMAVCQLVGKSSNPAAAQLSLQVVEPVLKARNPALLAILAAVQNGRAVTVLPNPMVRVDALGGAVLGEYPALVGATVMSKLPDLTLRRLAMSEALPVEMRGQAAMALARQTALPEDGALAVSLVSASVVKGVLPDAVRVAKTDVSGTEIADYVMANLRLGRVDAAVKALPQWLAMDDKTAAGQRSRATVRLLAAALQGKVGDGLWDAWMLALNLDNQTAVKQAQRTLVALEGIGTVVPVRVWQQMHDRALPTSNMTDPAWQRLLAAAVAAQDVPSVLGQVSVAWSGQPVAGVAPAVVGASVEALRRIGMEDVARRVAAEAVLGLPESHLMVLKAVEPQEGNEATLKQVLIGADAEVKPVVRPTAPVVEMLPPPRVEPVARPKAPTKPVVPKVSR